MAIDNAQLEKRVMSASGRALVPDGFRKDAGAWFVANEKTILGLVGTREEATLFFSAAFTMVNRIPKLLDCRRETFFNCLLHSMTTGLYPGPMQECVYIPFKDEAVFVPMYQGLVRLIYNSGQVKNVRAHVIWEADEFDYQAGSVERIIHKPSFKSHAERGRRVGVYCVIENRFGGAHIEFLPAERVDGIRARSKAAKSSESPWNSSHPDDVDWMWKKSAIKQASKMIAKSRRLAIALDLDNQADREDPAAKPVLDESVAGFFEETFGRPPQAKKLLEDPKPSAEAETIKAGIQSLYQEAPEAVPVSKDPYENI